MTGCDPAQAPTTRSALALNSKRTEVSEDVPPDPAALIESMRAFGYSLPAAVADLVDNSITAGAERIDVCLDWAGEASTISVLDDGTGMDAEGLRDAMRLGSRNPREERAPEDLGRFGLGLKTAAFSQATSLTVASKIAGADSHVRRWDLAHVTETGSWSLLTSAPPSVEHLLEPLAQLQSGTQVVLQGLDRLTGGAETEDEAAKVHFLRHTDAVEQHLAMVFHRFLGKAAGLTITINGNPIMPWDPFLAGSAHVQRLPPERLPLDGSFVHVAPFVLPHFSKLDDATHRRLAGPRGWNQQQGFYVYRAKRLLVAGGWLGLPFQAEEHYKLARIQVDLDNSMDHAWQIDVRKATARIPRPIISEMRRIADATRRRAGAAYRYRGKQIARKTEAEHAFVWSAKIKRDVVTYHIDRKHPVIAQAVETLGNSGDVLNNVLRLVEETVPVTSIVMDSREHPDADRDPFDGRTAEVDRMLRDAHTALTSHGVDEREALTLLASREPFNLYSELVAALSEEIET